MRSALLLALALATVGCSTFRALTGQIQEPKLELREIAFTDPSLDEATLLLKLEVQNPNPFELELDGVDYEMHLNEKPLSEGKLAEGLKLEPESSTQVNLPFRVKYTQVFDSLLAMLRQGKSPYRFKGDVRIGLVTTSFTKQGEVKLPRP